MRGAEGEPSVTPLPRYRRPIHLPSTRDPLVIHHLPPGSSAERLPHSACSTPAAAAKVPGMSKLQRHSIILELVRSQHVSSQEALRELLATRGFEVTQATLSRDIRELGLVKVPGEDGSRYAATFATSDPTPTLQRLLPALYLGAEGVGNLLIVRTLVGGAQPVAVALDAEEWPEVAGTIAGDDTIVMILRAEAQTEAVIERIEGLAAG